jgi:hypothetical protein
LDKILNISSNLILHSKLNFCEKQLASQLLTNWVLSSFFNNLTDKSYNSQSYIYINRYDLINNILKNIINFYIFFDPLYTETKEDQKKYKFFITQLVSFLSIEKKLYKTCLNKYFNKTKKTNIFLGIKNNYIKVNINYNLNIYFTEPTLYSTQYNTYFIGVHYSTLNLVFKKNIRNDDFFKLNDFKLLYKLKTLKYYFNKELYYEILNIILKEFSCNKEDLKSIIYNKINNILINDKIAKKFLNKNFFLNLNNYSLDTDDFNYLYDCTNNMFIFEDLIEYINDTPLNYSDNYYNNILNAKHNDALDDDLDFKQNILNHFIINTYSLDTNILNKYYSYLVFLSLDDLISKIDYFYLSYSFDFRGRLYSNSYISPMGDKLFRYIYTYGDYTNQELKAKQTLKITKNIDLILVDFVKLNNYCFFDVEEWL